VLDLENDDIQVENIIAEFSDRQYKSSDVKTVFETDEYDGTLKVRSRQ
jgi:hypothetical protein